MAAPDIASDPAEVHDQLWAGWSGSVGWDVGANTGQCVPDMLSRFDAVHSFEPSPDAFGRLTLAWGGVPRVTLHRHALGDRNGSLLTSVRQAPSESSQLVAVGMPYHGEDLGPNTAVWGEETGIAEVPCYTADDEAEWLGFPDFVKVDTEGHELAVLRGASGLLRGYRPGWLIEFHTERLGWQCSSVLRLAGYSVEVVRNPRYEPGSGMWRAHGWIRAKPR